MSRIEEIRARWAKATPGPWEQYCQGVYREGAVDIVADAWSDETAEAIAAAPEDVAWLLAIAEHAAAVAAMSLVRDGLDCAVCECPRGECEDCPLAALRAALARGER